MNDKSLKYNRNFNSYEFYFLKKKKDGEEVCPIAQ